MERIIYYKGSKRYNRRAIIGFIFSLILLLLLFPILKYPFYSPLSFFWCATIIITPPALLLLLIKSLKLRNKNLKFLEITQSSIGVYSLKQDLLITIGWDEIQYVEIGMWYVRQDRLHLNSGKNSMLVLGFAPKENIKMKSYKAIHLAKAAIELLTYYADIEIEELRDIFKGHIKDERTF